MSRGTRCGENCWRGSPRASKVQGHAERPEETLGSLQPVAPGLPISGRSGERGTYLVTGIVQSPCYGRKSAGLPPGEGASPTLRREGLGRWAAAAGPGRGRACTGSPASSAQSRDSGRPCTAQSPGHVPSPLRSLSRPGFCPPPAALSPRSTARRLRPSKKLAACGCNCTEGDTTAGALEVARGRQAKRVAPQRVDGGSRKRLFAVRLAGARTTVSLSLHLGGSGPDRETASRGPSPDCAGGLGCARVGTQPRGGGAGRAASRLEPPLSPAAAPGNPCLCGGCRGNAD